MRCRYSVSRSKDTVASYYYFIILFLATIRASSTNNRNARQEAAASFLKTGVGRELMAKMRNRMDGYKLDRSTSASGISFALIERAVRLGAILVDGNMSAEVRYFFIESSYPAA